MHEWNVRIPEITDSSIFILHMRKHALSALPTIVQLVHGRAYVSGSIPLYKIVCFLSPHFFFFLRQNKSYSRSSFPQIFWFIIGSFVMNVKIFMLRIRNEVCLKWFWELHCIMFFQNSCRVYDHNIPMVLGVALTIVFFHWRDRSLESFLFFFCRLLQVYF